MLGLQLAQPKQVVRQHHLVGDHGTGGPGVCGQCQLPDGGHGDAPGPGIELGAKELGRAGGFAVRGQVHTGLCHQFLHPAQVVLHRAVPQHGAGQGPVGLQQVPALLAHGGGGQGRGPRGVAFVGAGVQQRCGHASCPRALSSHSCRLSSSSLWLNEQLSSANRALDSSRSNRLCSTSV